MLPWVKLGSARSPNGTELSLWQRGEELVIRAGTADLMLNRMHASEELLAEHGCAGLGEGARVLIGGLGMGFTLRSALALLPASGRVVVAEIVPEVVEWVRGPIGGGALLDDARVAIDARDVAAVLREGGAKFDAILIDVDNGPTAMPLQGSNDWLYGRAGIEAAARSLRPGGRLAVWSAGDDPAYEARLSRFGFEAKTVRVRAHRAGPGARGRGARQVIFVGVKRAR